MPDPLSPEEVNVLKDTVLSEFGHLPRSISRKRLQRLFDTIDDRERERDGKQCIVTKNLFGTDTWEVNSSCKCTSCQLGIARAERDELQRKLDVLLKHGHKTGTALDFQSEIAYIDELNKKDGK